MKKGLTISLQVSVVLIPILVAILQFGLYKTSDLTLWKGGGFGMYSEPHPSSGRHVWLVGETKGKSTYYRLHQLDNRLDITRIKNEDLRDSLYDLAESAREMIFYPSLTSKQKLSNDYARLLTELESNAVELPIIPRDSTKLIVTELRITPDYQQMEMNTIYEYLLVP